MVDGNEVRIRHLEVALKAACRWLTSYVGDDVKAEHFDYQKAKERDQFSQEYLHDLRTIRTALGRD